MRYIIYQRVSTDKQDVENQLHHCINYIKACPDYTSHLLFEDPDVSASLAMEKRPGIMQLLETVRSGDRVVIAKLDRLSRDTPEMINICRMIRKKGAEILSLCEGRIEDWMLGIFGAIAQKEREDIILRTKNALSKKKANGERTGHIPYGYRLVQDIKRTKENKHIEIKLIESQEELRVLREIASLRASKVSYVDMAFILNKKKMYNRGSPWSKSALCRVYNNHLKRQKMSV